MARKTTATKSAKGPPSAPFGTLTLGELLAGRAAYNPRRISAHDAAQLAGSLEEFGLVQNFVWNRRTSRLVAGHQRLAGLEAAATDPARSFPVAFVDLDDDRERVLNVKLNRTGGDWDWDKLAELVEGLRASAPDAVADLGFTDAELAEVEQAGHFLEERVRAATAELEQLQADAPEPPPGEEDEPEEPDAARVPAVRPGDVWQVGPHRFACVNSTDAEAVAFALAGLRVALVVTDPPYAIYGSSTGVDADATDDRMVRPFFEALLRVAGELLPVFGHCYVCCDWRSWPSIWDAAKPSNLVPKNLVVWDKGGAGLGANYANCYELVGFLSKTPKRQAIATKIQTGQRLVNRPNLVRVNRVHGAHKEHNAQKPVELFAEFVKNSSDEGDVVLDLFGGSGTLVLAAAQEKRVGVALDVEPKWCDVAVRRAARVLEEPAELVGIQDGDRRVRLEQARLFADVARERGALP